MISIVVPIYNAENFLHRCVDSILAQSHTDFELLLINDGSKDGSGAICDAYAVKDRRVRVFHKENGGVSSARNLGLDNAQGKYITFCDADDYVASDWLAAYGKAVEENVDLAIQGYYEIEGLKILERKIVSNTEITYDIKQLVLTLFENGSFCFIWIKLFRRCIIESFNIRFDECSTLGEDAQFIAKYLENTTSCACVDRIGYYYNLPPNDKRYVGNSNYSVFHILSSLKIIFEGDIPRPLLVRHYEGLKDYMVTNIVAGNRLDYDYFEMFSRMIKVDGISKGVKERIVSSLILCCEESSSIAPFLLKIIHKSLKFINSLIR